MKADSSASSFQPPERSGPRDTMRSEQRDSLKMLLLTLCVLAPCIALALWARGEHWTIVGVPAALGLLAGVLLAALKGPRAAWIPIVLVYSTVSAGTLMVWVDGSVRSAGVLVILTALIGAGTYLRRNAMLLSVGLGFAALGALNLAEYLGWMQPHLKQHEMALWLTQGAVVVCLLVIVFYGRRRLERAFDTQQQALERWEQSTRALQASEARFAALFRSTPAATLVQRLDNREVLEVNQAFEKMFGYRRDTLLARPPPDLWANDSERLRILALLESEGHVTQLPATGRRRDGSQLECLLFAELLEAGSDRLIMTMLLDVTAEVAARRAQEKSEQRFAKAFNASPLGMTITRLSDGKFLEANPANERVLGFTREDFMARTSVEAGVWITEAERNDCLAALRRDGRLMGFETRMRSKHGEPVSVKIWSERIELDNEPCTLAFTINVNEEKRQQDMWRNVAKGVSGETGEAFFRSLVTHLASALGAVAVVAASIEDDGQIDAVASVCDGALQPPGPLPAQHPLLKPMLQHDGLLVTTVDRSAVADLCDTAASSEHMVFAGMALRDDAGSAIGLLGAFWPERLEPGPNLAALMTIFASRCKAELLRLRHDRELARLNATLEQRVAERTAQLQMLNRELDSFAYSVSHDLKSPLRSIDGFMHLLQEQTHGRISEEEQVLMARVMASARRMHGLINDLLALARMSQTQLKPAPVDLSALAEQVILQEALRDPAHAVEVLIEPGLIAKCDAQMALIVLENLLGNAWKYSAKAAQPRIEFVRLPPTATGLPRFAVRDNGAGFEMARADRLFKPFSRLHQPSEFQGSGIGLATVRRIIERHGGQISGEGQVGHGASFRFHFGRPEQG